MKGVWKSNYGGDYVVFRGPECRVVIHVCDLRGMTKEIPIANSPLSFDVQALQGSSNRNTPYCAGREVYYGPSARAALEAARGYVEASDADIPRRFCSYLSGR